MDAQPLHHFVESGWLELQQLRGALLNAIGHLQRLQNHRALVARDRVLQREPFGRNDGRWLLGVDRISQVIGQQLGADAIAGAQDDGALDRVLQLANVAWPGVIHQYAHRVRRHLADFALVLL